MANKGFGSTCVEAALELHGIAYDFEEADPLDGAQGLPASNRPSGASGAGLILAMIFLTESARTDLLGN